jgi:hypothetical protein
MQAREQAAAVVTLNERHFAGLVDVYSLNPIPGS